MLRKEVCKHWWQLCVRTRAETRATHKFPFRGYRIVGRKRCTFSKKVYNVDICGHNYNSMFFVSSLPFFSVLQWRRQVAVSQQTNQMPSLLNLPQPNRQPVHRWKVIFSFMTWRPYIPLHFMEMIFPLVPLILRFEATPAFSTVFARMPLGAFKPPLLIRIISAKSWWWVCD